MTDVLARRVRSRRCYAKRVKLTDRLSKEIGVPAPKIVVPSEGNDTDKENDVEMEEVEDVLSELEVDKLLATIGEQMSRDNPDEKVVCQILDISYDIRMRWFSGPGSENVCRMASTCMGRIACFDREYYVSIIT